jgi:hypothetical protein
MSVTIEFLWKDRKRYFGLPLSFTRYCLSEDRLFISEGFLNLKDDAYLLCHGMVAEAGQAEVWNERGIGSYSDPNRGFYLVKIDW